MISSRRILEDQPFRCAIGPQRWQHSAVWSKAATQKVHMNIASCPQPNLASLTSFPAGTFSWRKRALNQNNLEAACSSNLVVRLGIAIHALVDSIRERWSTPCDFEPVSEIHADP